MLAAASAADRRFPDPDMAKLMGQGLSQEQAWTALVVRGGNVREAMQRHWEPDESNERGTLPRPEDALSPKTPDRGKRS